MSTSILFAPVTVNRGRKFRGFGFVIGSSETGGYGWSQTNAKIWNPETKRVVYANMDFCEDVADYPAAELEAAQKVYIRNLIDDTIAWCRNSKPEASEDEIKRFARNVLLKHHRQLAEEIERALPINRDCAAEVANTLAWAATLVTRACWMYGRWCEGGRPLSRDRKLDIARKACEKKGLTNLPEFSEIWRTQTAAF